MDWMTLMGFFFGMFLIVMGIAQEGGGYTLGPLGAFLDFPSFLITFGGSIAATLVNYPLKQVAKTFAVAKKVFAEPDEDTSTLIGQFVTLSQRAKKEGFLALEKDAAGMENDFMKRAVQLVIAGQDANFIQQTLETEINFIQERHKIGQEIFNAMSNYFPAFGMIGTIIGLVKMLRVLEDPSQIAAGMAVALLTTFYGLVVGYLVCLPIAGKLKRRSESELVIKEIIIRGVLLLQTGTTPSLVEANLQAYLEPRLRQLTMNTRLRS
ncbi:MAG: MotA/TolQ/ExbB proton channel family protein [Elusimicrobia bacterium]|nr:MotA/TolQ/ExbB proton channel family protein [Elusimicrobiota bacterium]